MASNEAIKREVHPALYKPTHIQKVEATGQLGDTLVSVKTPNPPVLPKKERKKPRRHLPVMDTSSLKKQLAKTSLRRRYTTIPPLPPELTPDCASCKTSACCSSFMVDLTKEEYESGLYGDYAVKMTKEAIQQLKNSDAIRFSMLQLGDILEREQEEYYFLEGSVGKPCPLLGENGCTIYKDRPLTCRTYTCVMDPRITQGMRDGTEPIPGEFLHD